MKVEISIGDAIDKYNILEIKQKNITDPEKLNDISAEISLLEECKNTINANLYYYKILTHVNEKIWNLTNQIKKLNHAENAAEFSQISHDIFEYNQKRYRLKTIFNNLCNSDIKERKSYEMNSVYLYIKDNYTIYKKLAEINSLCVDYDFVFVGGEYLDTVKKYVNAPNIREAAEENRIYTKEIRLDEYSLSAEMISIFEYAPIVYIAGGLFGDFIHQISVIHEKFLETGRKGVLYITDSIGDNFRRGVENTYNDICEVISSQYYIKEFKFYCGGDHPVHDVNLSVWRNSPTLRNGTWYAVFRDTYNVEWGTHTWLNEIQVDETWANKIIINRPAYKNICNFNFDHFREKFGNEPIVFMSIDRNDYDVFIGMTNLNVEFYCPPSFRHMCVALKSCKFYIGTCSGCSTLAHAMHVPRLISSVDEGRESMEEFGLNNILPNIYMSIDELYNAFKKELSKEELSDELKRAKQSIEELQNKLNEANSSREINESYSKFIEDKNRELEARANELEARANELHQRFYAIEQYKTDLENRANDLQNRVNDSEARANDMQNRMNELSELQVNYQKRISFLENELSEFKK